MLSLLGVAEGEVCGCTKVHTMCSLMQHDIEMSCHFGELNTCVHAHVRIVLCSGQSPQDQWCV